MKHYISEIDLTKAHHGESYSISIEPNAGLFEIDIDNYSLMAYSIVDGIMILDESYVSSVDFRNSVKNKLVAINNFIQDLTLDFAAENSEILYTLVVAGNITSVEKEAHVVACRAALKPAHDCFSMFSYPEGLAAIDAVVRDSVLLTDPRLTGYKSTIQAFLASV